MALGQRQGASKGMIRVANQAKLKSWREKPKYMHGYLVPQNYAQAVKRSEERRVGKD